MERYDSAEMEAQRLMREIRDLVNDERQHQNLSFKQIAYRCSVSEKTIMGALTRPEHLTIRGLTRIMNALEVEVEIKKVS